MKSILCIAVHDVAPATWPQCKALLRLIDEAGAPPATLLVVPDYHRSGAINTDRAFTDAIDRRIARGDEVALHGYYHFDDGPAPQRTLDWLRRRHLTLGEGEFAALSEGEACMRLDAGLRLFDRVGWSARGFVAPAWLLGSGARAALPQMPIGYTSTHTHLETPCGGKRVYAPAISVSARSAWRRWTSRRWLAAARAFTANAPVLRLALHPEDARHVTIMQAWRDVLRALVAERTPMTKSAAMGLA